MTSDLCEEDVVQIETPQIISAEELVSTMGGGGGGGGVGCVARVQTSSAAVELGRRLLLAARAGDTPAVLDLMAKGAPFTTDWLGTSPLHLAAANGHAATCAVLLRAGVMRDSRTKVERTPLHLAAHAGHADVVALLLDHGAILDCRDMLQMTPLHWAAARGHVSTARALLRRGADVRARCKFRHTPRSLAARNRHHLLVALLDKAEADALAAPPPPPSPPHPPHPPPDPLAVPAEQIISEETRKVFGIRNLTKSPESKSEKSKLKSQQEPISQPKQPEPKPATGQRRSSAAAAQLLRAHGIALLPPDDGGTVLSALQSGRTVVLSDAGKLMLKESELPSEPASESSSATGKDEEEQSEVSQANGGVAGSVGGGNVQVAGSVGGSGSTGMVLRATPVRTPPRGVKVFSVNHKLVLPTATNATTATNKAPIKKVINPHDLQQMKFVQLSSEGTTLPKIKNVTMKAKHKLRPGPVKIFMNKSNFNKLIANAKANVISVPLNENEGATAASIAGTASASERESAAEGEGGADGAGGAGGESEEVRRLRAQLSEARAALAAAAAELRAARARLAIYEPITSDADSVHTPHSH